MKTKPLRGKALLKAAWNHIAKNPKQWRQMTPWISRDGCGCLGAHAAQISGIPIVSASKGFELCNLDHHEGNGEYLFHPERTMPELRARVVKICGARGVLPVPKGFK
jgi:hypothetical protein